MADNKKEYLAFSKSHRFKLNISFKAYFLVKDFTRNSITTILEV